MDLGIQGKTAIVCASSRGLGRGCAEALAAEGVNVVINGRDAATLENTAEALRQQYGVEVTVVAADVGSDAGREALLEACSAPDILINNNGGPPPGMWSDWGREAWTAAIEQNMLTPIFMINAVYDVLCRDICE